MRVRTSSCFTTTLFLAIGLTMGAAGVLAQAPGDGSGGEPALALTPIIGVDPTSLDFGCVDSGDCTDLTVDLFNDVQDPESQLEITGLDIVVPLDGARDGTFTVTQPSPPFTISGDGSHVPVNVRFCATAPASAEGAILRITASNATNSPLDVPLAGIANELPVCDPGGPYSGEVGQAIQFDGSASSDPGGTVVAYDWAFGDGANGSGAQPTHVYGAAQVYTVTLTVTDDCSTTSVCTTTADINAPPVCDADGPYTGIVGETISFNGTGSSDPDGTIESYAWDFGDGSTGSGATPTHQYAVALVYTVTLCVVDDNQAESCCATTASIDPSPTAVELASFTATQEGNAVLLRWRTSAEVDNLGFDVLRVEAGSGGEWAAVNASRIEGGGNQARDYSFTDRTVTPGRTYDYRLESLDLEGGRERYQPLRVQVARAAPERLALLPGQPNPFNPSTTLRFELPAAGRVSLIIYDTAGRPVRTLAAATYEAGAHAITWDGRDDGGQALASGVYFLQLRAPGASMTRKLVMAR